MLTGRRYGGVQVTSFPSIQTAPSVGSSNPPIMRSRVVLPHPDGPRSEKNSPRRMSSETASTAATSPKRLVRLRISTLCSVGMDGPGAYPLAGPSAGVLLETDPQPEPQRPWLLELIALAVV